MANEHAIGKLVVSRTANKEEAIRNNPWADLSVRAGNVGEITSGPLPYYRADTDKDEPYWGVKWSDGNVTWSWQNVLIVIGDKNKQVEVEHEEKQTV